MKQSFLYIIKKALLSAGVFLLLCFLLQYPKEALAASRDGLNLWLNTLIPTLLPFLILTGFLVHTNGIEKILKPFAPFLKLTLGLSPAGAYVFLLGLLCGYPMGAKLAADLYRYGKISRREGEYLLTFCNNPSPAFLTTYLAHVCLKDKVRVSRILFILVLADVLCMLFFRFVVYHNHTILPPERLVNNSSSKKETPHPSSAGALIDVSIMNGFETIARLGGYILLFSILSACVSHFWCIYETGRCLTLGILEITTGLHGLATSDISFGMRFLCSITMTAFGGLCIMAQTKSVLDGNLSMHPYASAKCLNAAITAIVILLFIL